MQQHRGGLRPASASRPREAISHLQSGTENRLRAFSFVSPPTPFSWIFQKAWSMSRVHPRCRVDPSLRPNDATALLRIHYRRFNAHTGSSVADRRIDIPPRGFATCRFSTYRPSTFTCSAAEPELRSCRLYTGCRWVDLQISLPAYPAGTLHPTVLTAS